MLTEEEKIQFQKIDEQHAAKKAQRAAEAEQKIAVRNKAHPSWKNEIENKLSAALAADDAR